MKEDGLGCICGKLEERETARNLTYERKTAEATRSWTFQMHYFLDEPTHDADDNDVTMYARGRYWQALKFKAPHNKHFDGKLIERPTSTQDVLSYDKRRRRTRDTLLSTYSASSIHRDCTRHPEASCPCCRTRTEARWRLQSHFKHKTVHEIVRAPKSDLFKQCQIIHNYFKYIRESQATTKNLMKRNKI